jgi:hypothetical protein
MADLNIALFRPLTSYEPSNGPIQASQAFKKLENGSKEVIFLFNLIKKMPAKPPDLDSGVSG